MRHKHTIGLALLGIAATYWVAKQTGDPTTRPANSQPSDRSTELARMQNELRVLRHDMRSLRGNQARRSDGVDVPVFGATPEPVAVAAQNQKPPAMDGHTLAATQRDLAEHRLSSEGVDGKWAAHAESQLDKALTDLGATSISCRATLCKVSLEFANTSARDKAMQAIPNATPWDSEGFFHAGAGGLKIAVYIAREGKQLPRAAL